MEGETHLILSLSTILGAALKSSVHLTLFIFLKYSYRVNCPLVESVDFSVTDKSCLSLCKAGMTAEHLSKHEKCQIYSNEFEPS